MSNGDAVFRLILVPANKLVRRGIFIGAPKEVSAAGIAGRGARCNCGWGFSPSEAEAGQGDEVCGPGTGFAPRTAIYIRRNRFK